MPSRCFKAEGDLTSLGKEARVPRSWSAQQLLRRLRAAAQYRSLWSRHPGSVTSSSLRFQRLALVNSSGHPFMYPRLMKSWEKPPILGPHQQQGSVAAVRYAWGSTHLLILSAAMPDRFAWATHRLMEREHPSQMQRQARGLLCCSTQRLRQTPLSAHCFATALLPGTMP